ncbi:MAG: hypothetical protein AAF645_22520 [Myxococcota bacterium]
MLRLLTLSAVLLSAVLFSACGDDDTSAPDASDRDVGRDESTDGPGRDASRETGTGDACEGFSEGEGRCMSPTRTETCFRGRLVARSCREGFGCIEEDGDAACQCNNEDDGFCPDRCRNDPDCADCTPSCGAAECGSDGCGGECGTCAGTAVCLEGRCEEPTGICLESCDFSDDGDCDDGGPDSDFSLCDYGTDCTDCGPRAELPVDCRLNFNADCAPDQRCECDEGSGTCLCEDGPRGDRTLGDACDDELQCESGACIDARCSAPCERSSDCDEPLSDCQPFLGFCVEGACQPDCTDRECGDDGCGGTCGICEGGTECAVFSCEAIVGDGVPCSGAPAACAQGEGCCFSAAGTGVCFDHGGRSEASCLDAAAEGAYAYVGCNEDSDCVDGTRCCGDGNRTFCALTCGDAAAACNLDTQDCGADSDLRCCPIDGPAFVSGGLGVGRCLPLTCP